MYDVPYKCILLCMFVCMYVFNCAHTRILIMVVVAAAGKCMP